MKTIFSRLILLLLFVPTVVFSQTQSFKKYDSQSGFNQSAISCFSQTPEGYLWLGTEDGLVQFNGFKFVENRTGLSERNITSSFVDKQGVLWLGHNKGGVSKRESGKFKKIKNSPAKSQIVQITQDKKDRVLAASKENGIIHLNLDQPATYTFADNEIYSLTETKEGLFAGTSTGLYKISLSVGKVIIVKTISTFSGKPIKSIVNVDNQLYIGLDSALFVLDIVSNQVFNLSKTLPTPKVNGLFKDNNNNVWVATSKGFVLIPPSKKIQVFGEDSGIDNSNITNIFQDREGNVWLANNDGGLYKQENSFLQQYTSKNGLFNENLQCFFVDRDNSIWAGSENGITHITFYFENIGAGFYVSRAAVDFRPTSIPITAIYRTKGDENIWVGTTQKGLLKYELSSNYFYAFKQQNMLASYTINHIIEDRNGNMWISTPTGVHIYNQETKELNNDSSLLELKSLNVKRVFEDKKGNIWFILKGKGIAMLSNYGTIKLFDTGLGSREINYITEDKKGVIWFASNGNGIYKMTGRTFVNYTTTEGLSSNTIQTISVDQNNSLWLGSRTGISKFNPTTKKSVTYNPQGTIASVYDVNSGAVAQQKNGSIFFGTRYGLLAYYPQNDIPNTTKPGIVITKLTVNGKEKSFTEELNLPYSKNQWDVKFLYEGITFSNTENIKYKYLLEGHDTKWSEPTTQTEVLYNRLDYGDYVFKVKVCNSKGICSEVAMSQEISISAPIWTKWWFHTIGAICVLLLLSLLLKLREIKYRKDQLVLEDAVFERTKKINTLTEELNKINDLVKQLRGKTVGTNKEIGTFEKLLDYKNKELDKIYTIINTDIKKQLNKISVALKSNDSDHKTEIQERVAKAERIIQIVSNYGKAGKEDQTIEKVNVSDMLNKLATKIKEEHTNRTINLTFQSDIPDIIIQKQLLSRVLGDLMENSIVNNSKNECRIHVSYSKKGELHQFNVSDNGSGIEAEDQEKLFEIIQPIKSQTDSNSSIKGLAIAKKIIEENGGKIKVDSEHGKGSTFSFTWQGK